MANGRRRPRRRAVGRLHRRARGARAARRRQEALPRQGRPQGGRQRHRRHRPGRRRHGRLRPGRARRADDRARRHADQGEAGRQRHPRRLAGRRQGGGRGPRAAALPVRRRRQRPDAAGAAHEHPERRRPRRLQRRHPGVHGGPARRAQLRRGAALRRRDLPRPQEGAEGEGRRDRAWATRAATPRASPPTRRRWPSSWRRSRQAGLKPGKQVALALDCAASEFFDKKSGKYVLEGRGEDLRRQGARRLLRRALRPSTPSSPSRTAATRTTGRRWKLLTDKLGERDPARRRRPLRHQRRAARRAASPRGWPTRSS